MTTGISADTLEKGVPPINGYTTWMERPLIDDRIHVTPDGLLRRAKQANKAACTAGVPVVYREVQSTIFETSLEIKVAHGGLSRRVTYATRKKAISAAR